ncbi:hypothetical protein OJF2_66270 [Aquisphaera giovannonii]|uniref:Uncharacterized protein n=1 Tax=Aquisphaera giovannonii TaxID=406548 RepID=A0A5B9WDK2_9BACT|nr:hypothetical protein [Aquisphaera giovannonii]QEH38031.1 hypothetical protein OJF2_66270 [Aquisphaera giovannonii]
MNFFEQVIGILNARFPGEFVCRPGDRGMASGLEIRRAGKSGHAFLYDAHASRPLHHLLSLHDEDGRESGETWSTSLPDECVARILPWAFPREWTRPAPLDPAEERRRLSTLAEGLAGRRRIPVRLEGPDPNLMEALTAEGRLAFERDVAALNPARIRQNFPWDPHGRLALDAAALLAVYPCSRRLEGGRFLTLAAIGPKRRRGEQEIRVGPALLFPVNQTHRWLDRPWLWQATEPPASERLGIGGGSAEEECAARSLRLLDEGEIEEALALHGVAMEDDLLRLLGGQRIDPPACCAHPDEAWTDLLVATLRQSAPWLLPAAVAMEGERIRHHTGKKSGRPPTSWKLVVFPGQFHSRKASLMLVADRDGRNPRFEIEATASNARLADTSWKRPLEVDLRRYGIATEGQDARGTSAGLVASRSP